MPKWSIVGMMLICLLYVEAVLSCVSVWLNYEISESLINVELLQIDQGWSAEHLLA
jgi:hypothetical protein